MSDNEEDIGPSVYDTGDGIRIELPVADGIGIYCDMSDEDAQQFINIIQNKLNARFKSK